MEEYLRSVSVEAYVAVLMLTSSHAKQFIVTVTYIAYRVRSTKKKNTGGSDGSTTPRGTPTVAIPRTQASDEEEDDEEFEEEEEEGEEDDDEEEEREMFSKVYLTDAGFFWQIEGKPETNSIYVTTGGIGSSGKRRARHFDSVEGAQDYYTLRIRQQLARGWKDPEDEDNL